MGRRRPWCGGGGEPEAGLREPGQVVCLACGAPSAHGAHLIHTSGLRPGPDPTQVVWMGKGVRCQAPFEERCPEANSLTLQTRWF